MGRVLRILFVEDSESDALLIARELRKGGLAHEFARVESAGAMESAMAGGEWDALLCDCQMPLFSAESALEIWKHAGGDRPFIVVSGAIGEEEAVALLKAMGLHLAIDDFGTGYSSLSYLKRFPIDTLKIDRSFIRDISFDPDDRILCQAIIALAHTLNLMVVAEGVETEDQLACLRTWECDLVQGRLFSEPLSPEGFEAFVMRGQTSPRDSDRTAVKGC